MSSNPVLDAAIEYAKAGICVIPVRVDKKPFLKWEEFQRRHPSLDEIYDWWDKWPMAGVGIVTGEISGIYVVDVDVKNGKNGVAAFKELAPGIKPTVKTISKGFHFYFRSNDKINNAADFKPGLDFRGDGGYVVAPPTNGYRLVNAFKKLELELIPENIRNNLIICKNHAKPENAPLDHAATTGLTTALEAPTTNVSQTTFDHIGTVGRRDNDIFRLANVLVKGGMPVKEVEGYLKFYSMNCNPPFPEREFRIKLESALKRAESRDRNISGEARDCVCHEMADVFTMEQLYRQLDLKSRREKKTCVMAVNRLLEDEDPVIERVGGKGMYRKVSKECDEIDWKSFSEKTVDLWLPFDLDQIAAVSPGSIIVVAGDPNAGKTATLMNIARYNMKKYGVHYFSSETGPGAFKRRAQKFHDIHTDQWNVKFYQRGANFADVIKPGVGNLNIIDYLELYDNFYLVARYLAEIFEKLKGAIAIVAIQKTPGKDDGIGGMFTQQKPALVFTLNRKGFAKVTKIKEWKGTENIQGKIYDFKLVDGCRFIKTMGWHYPLGEGA